MLNLALPPFLGLELTIHVIKSQIHFVRQSLLVMLSLYIFWAGYSVVGHSLAYY
jgi:hypothetical protein